MSTRQLVVKTESSLLQELKTSATDFLREWSKDHNFNFSNVVLVTMTIVEKYSSEHINIGSADKFKMAQSLISIVLDIAVEMGKLNKDDGEALKKNFEQSGEVVKELIESYIELSHNPRLIQLGKVIEEEISGCLGGCKKTK